MKSPWAQKHAATCAGLAPRAPRSPISRVFRTTDIRRELVTEKAATMTMKRSRKKIIPRSRLSTQRKSEKLSSHEKARMSSGSAALIRAAASSSFTPSPSRTSIPWTVDPRPYRSWARRRVP